MFWRQHRDALMLMLGAFQHPRQKNSSQAALTSDSPEPGAEEPEEPEEARGAPSRAGPLQLPHGPHETGDAFGDGGLKPGCSSRSPCWSTFFFLVSASDQLFVCDVTWTGAASAALIGQPRRRPEI